MPIWLTIGSCRNNNHIGQIIEDKNIITSVAATIKCFVLYIIDFKFFIPKKISIISVFAYGDCYMLRKTFFNPLFRDNLLVAPFSIIFLELSIFSKTKTSQSNSSRSIGYTSWSNLPFIICDSQRLE